MRKEKGKEVVEQDEQLEGEQEKKDGLGQQPDHSADKMHKCKSSSGSVHSSSHCHKAGMQKKNTRKKLRQNRKCRRMNSNEDVNAPVAMMKDGKRKKTRRRKKNKEKAKKIQLDRKNGNERNERMMWMTMMVHDH